MKKDFALLSAVALVAFITASDIINLLVLSDFIWPGQAYRAFQMGLLISVRLISDSFSGLLWGWAADRFSRKILFALGSFLTSIIIFANALLPVGGGDPNYFLWLTFRMMLGLGLGCFGPVTNSLVPDLFEKHERSGYYGRGTLVFSVFQILGMIISSNIFILGAWRFYYFITGAMYFALALFLVFRFEEPKRGNKEMELRKALEQTDAKYEYKITKDTMRSVLLSRSNILVLLEGIFTSLFFGIVDLVLIPFIQGPPRNVSPSVSSYLILLFSIPATIIGSVYLAKFSDRKAKQSIKNRLNLIIIGLIIGAVFVSLIFLIPIPSFSREEGDSFLHIIQVPSILAVGFVLFVSRVSFSIFNVNQTPIIQELNLPETQGTMKSLNQLVEVLGYALGPVFAGILIVVFGGNYFALTPCILLFSLPGIVMWILVFKSFDSDRKRISQVLSARAEQIEKESKHKD